MDGPRIRWSDDVVWREEGGRREEALRRMGAGETPDRLGVVTLSAEDRISQLNFVGAEIWCRCDGTRTVTELAAELEEVFQVEPGRLQRDVDAFVQDLVERGWLVQEP